MYKFLIVECKELNDQYECDADRTPLYMINDLVGFFKNAERHYLTPFEVYFVEEGGKLRKIIDYDESNFYEWIDNDGGFGWKRKITESGWERIMELNHL